MIRAGDSLLIFLLSYKSMIRFKRVSKKDLTFHGKRKKPNRLRYIMIFFGRCVSFRKRPNLIKLRSYVNREGFEFDFFKTASNICNVKILDKHKRFLYKNKYHRASLKKLFVLKHRNKLRRMFI